MMTLLSRLPVKLAVHQNPKILRSSPGALALWRFRGRVRAAERAAADRTTLPGSTCRVRTANQSGPSEPGCADHELGLLDLADALLRYAPQAYVQQAYADTLAHINRCPTCRADLIDLVLTTLHYEAHLPITTNPVPTEEGPHDDA